MTPPKKIYGLIGYPVKHSLSPTMHNAAFKALGIDAEYRLFEVKPEGLEDFLLNLDTIVKDTKGNSIRTGDVVGFNITLPHKVRAKEILEKEGFSWPQYFVPMTGATNTVNRETRRCYNTDAPGFIRSLQLDLTFDTFGKNVTLIGCGGAGRAVVAGLAGEINKIYIYDSNHEAIQSAQKQFSAVSRFQDKFEFVLHRERLPEIIKQCQLLVNASPVGMKEGDGSPIDKDWLHKDLFVYDLVYNRNTQLVRDAKEKCKSAAGGLVMLLYQGAIAFELWTGSKLEKHIEIMREALLGQMEGKL